MNILIINGSPKAERSNTLKLTNAFVEGINDGSKDDKVNIERLNISQLNISSCLGCFACWKQTPGKCVIQDDMAKVIEKLLWANITIWSFPLYYFNIPGKLKTLIDRQLPMTLPFMSSEAEAGGHPSRYDMSEKKTVLISTCGFYTAKSNYDSVIAQFDKMYGKEKFTTIFCGQGELFRVPELSKRTDEYLNVVRQAGQEYISGGIKENTKMKLQELLYPRDVFERMADASWGISKTGEKEDFSLTFTKQMAALYNPASYKGKDVVFDINYTDIGKRYRIVLGKTKSHVLEEFEGPPITVIHTPFSIWQSIAAGEISGPAALMEHKYYIEGDFDLMLKWDEYFSSTQSKSVSDNENSTTPKAKTNMQYLLIPWIVFCIAVNINTFWGSIISILVAAFVPLVFYKNKKTIYDVITIVMINVFSILLIINLSPEIIIPISNVSFGLMWIVSLFLKIPLTAEYSMNDYGGETALENPMFIQTNSIITLAWGIFYLITPIVTYFIVQTSLKSYVGIINSILPALMGIFTIWFQKWYPKKIAQGK